MLPCRFIWRASLLCGSLQKIRFGSNQNIYRKRFCISVTSDIDLAKHRGMVFTESCSLICNVRFLVTVDD